MEVEKSTGQSIDESSGTPVNDGCPSVSSSADDALIVASGSGLVVDCVWPNTNVVENACDMLVEPSLTAVIVLEPGEPPGEPGEPDTPVRVKPFDADMVGCVLVFGGRTPVTVVAGCGRPDITVCADVAAVVARSCVVVAVVVLGCVVVTL